MRGRGIGYLPLSPLVAELSGDQARVLNHPDVRGAANVKIAVLGTGAVGGVLGYRWAQLGHQVFFGSRTPDTEPVRALVQRSGRTARAGTCAEAVADAEVVLLATPWEVTHEMLDGVGKLDGKILLDCINPLTADLKDLQFGFTDSAAEKIASWFPAATVVKAFNTLSAATMENPMYGETNASMFYCGDDADAKAVARQLTEELGFDAIDCGPLRISRHLEALAMLYVHLAIFEGWGGDCAFKMLKR
jgi:NADPH-dependent F420 reductase